MSLLKRGNLMEFDIKKSENPNTRKYEKEDLQLAYDFSKRVYDEFGQLVKAIVLFGSTAKYGKKSSKGDIDILVIVDDVSMVMTREIIETYRIITEKTIVKVSPRLHVTSIKLSTFWEYIRSGDPVGMNILRSGVPLLDTGFFEPLRALLIRGRIRPSPEAIWTYFARAPRTVHNAKWHVLQALLDLYWAVIDAAHAALMKLGTTPPSPDHVAEMLNEKMVKPKIITKRYSDIMAKFYKLQKDITYRNVKDVSGKQFDLYVKDAEDFVNEMERVINK